MRMVKNKQYSPEWIIWGMFALDFDASLLTFSFFLVKKVEQICSNPFYFSFLTGLCVLMHPTQEGWYF